MALPLLRVTSGTEPALPNFTISTLNLSLALGSEVTTHVQGTSQSLKPTYQGVYNAFYSKFTLT